MLVGTGGAGCCNSGGAKKRVAKKPAAKSTATKRVRKPKAKKGGNPEDDEPVEQKQLEDLYEGENEKEQESTERQEGGARKKKGSKVVAKRALTPYNKFVKKHFSALKKKFPNDKAPQIMKKIAIEWKKTKK
jgi:hypothetical protein